VTRWLIHNGIPVDQVALMEEWELLANAIVFGQFANGGLEWDWESMQFIERQ
jgi:hypothetical protein